MEKTEIVNQERTLVLIKPEGVRRAIVGKILERFEDAGLKIIGMKMVFSSEELAGKHYDEDIAKRHGDRVRNNLLKHIREGPVIAFVLEGIDAIAVTRKLVGSTYPNEAPVGTIRGDFGHISKLYANSREMPVRNLIHASGDAKDAKREIPLWFTSKELHSYKTVHDLIQLCE